jgi:aryl-alcohol dehydrogenase-like predicted oxidoreductase
MESNILPVNNPGESSLKLHIGTANFGTPYGVYGKSTLIDQSDVRNILYEASIDKNIYIDTAESYFNSEIIIGENAPFKLNNKITTKIIVGRNDKFDSIPQRVKESLTRVKQESFFIVWLVIS